MTVTLNQIGWSSYGNFEGPYFMGRCSYVLPDIPSENDQIMAVVTAAEGGHYDAINMYDSGIISVGLIQWIDAGQHSVDDMLGKVAEDNDLISVRGPLLHALDASNAEFKKNANGKWRFFIAGNECATNDQLRKLFMKSCGTKGSWNDDAKYHAKTWAACMATLFSDPGAQKSQIDYTVPKLKGFLATDVKKSLYDDQPSVGWVGAARAALISYAVNLPAVAAAQYRSFATKTAEKWSPDWCIGLIKQVTFGGHIGIWPNRYNAIRPVLEKLFEVTLPKTSKDLAAWKPTGDVSAKLTPTKVVVDNLIVENGAGSKICSIVHSYVGCSLLSRRDELGKLVARDVDKPESVVVISTNCATTALGILWKAGVKHDLLTAPYNGSATSSIVKIGSDLGATVQYVGPSGPQPKPGSLLRYNTVGTNNDHFEWLLCPVDGEGNADHAGGGRANNEISEGTGPIYSSWGRPLIEWLDPDKLGIVVSTDDVQTPNTESQSQEQASAETTAQSVVLSPSAKEPLWKFIWNFIMTLVNILLKKKQ